MVPDWSKFLRLQRINRRTIGSIWVAFVIHYTDKKMKSRLIFFATVMAYLAFSACSRNSELKSANDSVTKTAVAVTDSVGQPETKPASNFELLQGKWQSEADKTNFLVFDQNRRKEISEGMQSWDDEAFTLTNQCQNESNQADGNPKEKDRYISSKKSDLCWYIVSITQEKLTLQYMGRGNTLVYNRVK